MPGVNAPYELQNSGRNEFNALTGQDDPVYNIVDKNGETVKVFSNGRVSDWRGFFAKAQTQAAELSFSDNLYRSQVLAYYVGASVTATQQVYNNVRQALAALTIIGNTNPDFALIVQAISFLQAIETLSS